MGWFDFLGSGGKVPEHVPAPDQKRHLVLYKYDTCGYCVRVMRAVDRLGVDIDLYKDVVREPESRDELRERTGRGQVPCLFIDDEPLHESADIIAWLEAYAKATA